MFKHTDVLQTDTAYSQRDEAKPHQAGGQDMSICSASVSIYCCCLGDCSVFVI